MTTCQFEILLDKRIGKVRAVLASKAKEYATDIDRLDSFKQAAKLTGEKPAEALLGMLVKHWVSVRELVRVRYEYGTGYATPDLIDEKIGDAINYLILLEALFAEGE